VTDVDSRAILHTLVSRGDTISIEKGKLIISPASGAKVPSKWLETQQEGLIIAIIEVTKMQAYRYLSYTTGSYGAKRYNGVTLQFESVIGLNSYYFNVNAKLVRTKNTNSGKAGTTLPKGHFRVGKHSALVKFWNRTRLPLPARLAALHDYMGNLKPLYFTAEQQLPDGRLRKDTVFPLAVNADAVATAIIGELVPQNAHTGQVQLPYKPHTKIPYEGLPAAPTQQGLQPNSTTGEKNYGISNQGSKVIRKPHTYVYNPIDPKSQTTDEWLADYGAGALITQPAPKLDD
jgi:hypothetical protein